MFFGKCLRVGWTNCENNGEKPVVIVVMVPVSEGKLTLAWYVVQKLSVFGGSAVVSGYHAILG